MVSKRIFSLMVLKSFTKKDLADILGIKYCTILKKFENDAWSKEEIGRLSDILNTTTDYLIKGE